MSKRYLINPLPPVGEPYKEAWGNIYDYYGNRVENRDKRHVGGEYNESIDNIYNAFMHYILPFFFEHDVVDDKKEKRFKETETSNAIEIFTTIYGGFEFNSLMCMIESNPSRLLDALASEREKWVENLFHTFLSAFCKETGILEIHIPPNSAKSMKELFLRHATNPYRQLQDWKQYMQYSVGIEVASGEIFELRASDICSDWIVGNLIKDLVGTASSLKYGIEKLDKHKKFGLFEKIFLKQKIISRKTIDGMGYLC